MEKVLRDSDSDLKDHHTLGQLPSSQRYWKIQIVATRIIMISKTSRNALSVSSSWYTDSDIASQRFKLRMIKNGEGWLNPSIVKLLSEKMRMYRR